MKSAALHVILIGILFLPPTLGLAAPFEGGSAVQRADAQQVFTTAERAFQRGEFDQALSRFRAFVLRYSDSPLIPQAYAFLGRIFIQQQHYSDALLYLNRLAPSARTAEIQLLSGYALAMLGDHTAALERLQPLATSTMDPRDRQLLLVGLAQAYESRQSFLHALYFYRQALPGSSNPEDLLETAHQLLTNPAAADQLAEAAFLFRDTPIGQDALLQLARRQLATHQQQKALDSLRQIVASQITFPWRSEAATLLDGFSQGRWLQTQTLGALLPLSGPYQTFGTLVQRGIEMALALRKNEASAIRVLYRDTAGEPTNARLAVNSLVNEDRVIAMLGPLTSAAALAAAAEAERNETPILTLSQRTNIADVGPFVFRNSLTARLQARKLARYAINDQGFSSFGILAPENPLGRAMAELFSDEVLKLGGLVTFEQSYPEDATDFREQILPLMGKSPRRQKENYQPQTEAEKLDALFIPEEPDYPSTTFDALFIPDYAERIGQIAPQLAFYGIDDLPLLGINGWNSPELLRLAGRYVEGAVFVDGFFLESNQPIVQEFIRLYRETYAEDPTILEAQAFDSANILFSLLERKDLDSRRALRNALARLRNYPGVTGNTSFDFTGEADKNLFLLQVQNGKIVQIP